MDREIRRRPWSGIPNRTARGASARTRSGDGGRRRGRAARRPALRIRAERHPTSRKPPSGTRAPRSRVKRHPELPPWRHEERTPAGGQIGGRLRSVASTATGFCGRPDSQAFSRERPSRRRFPPGCGPGRARPLRPPPAAGAADHAIDVSDIAAAVGPDCVTIMQRRPSNYVHGAESDAKFIERPAGLGMFPT